MMRLTTLVTGANGFIGRHLCGHLARSGRDVVAVVRPGAAPAPSPERPARIVPLPLLGAEREWLKLLAEVDSVIHLAARVHVMRETAEDPLAAFRRVNVEATAQLAALARRAGVRRLVYLSSIKVNGEATGPGCASACFGPEDEPAYSDPYGQSKWEAEQALAQAADGAAGDRNFDPMEWVVVRPPLVFGPGVRGNFLSLVRAVERGVPLPIGAIRNRRSLVSVYNLVDLLEKILDHPAAPGQRFLVKDGSDAEDLSTGELVRRLARALGGRPRLVPLLVPVPGALLSAAGWLVRRQAAVARLCSSLVLDTSKTRELLDWRAPMTLDQGLERTCAWFKTAGTGSRMLL